MSRPFTSDLSADEALLLEEVGFEPVDFVMHGAYYHAGYQLMSWSDSQELTTLTETMVAARDDALEGLLAQAEQVGADGIVGVRIEMEHRGHQAEFLARGTAVKGRTSSWKVGGKPFTSDLSGQDFWALVRSGHRPHQLVMGCCVYHVAHQSLGSWLGKMGQNREMPNFTQALYSARETAMERMQAEATATGATGVVGVHLEEGNHGWHTHVMEFLALGTSIGPSGEAPQHEPVLPTLSIG